MTKGPQFRFPEPPVLLLVTGVAAGLFYLALRWFGLPIDSLTMSALLVGAALGIRLRVHVLLLTTAMFSVATVIVRSPHANHETYAIGLNVLAVNTAHQIGYLFGVASVPYLAITRKWMRVIQSKVQSRNVDVRDQGDDSWIDLASENLPLADIQSEYRLNAGAISAKGDRPRSPIGLTPTGDLLKAVESLARAATPDAIHDIIRSSARRLIGSDGVALILADGDECHYVEEDAVGPLWKGRKFKMSECISGWSMMNRRIAIIPDIATDARIPHHLYAETFVKSLIMTPVGADYPIGALGAYWASTYQPTDYEIETVQILARVTAAALENANLIATLSRSLVQAELRHGELRHRADNAYLTARALAHSSLPSGWAEVFSTRMATLARTYQDIEARLARQGEIDIRELIRAELGVYAASRPDRFKIDGTSLRLDRPQAMALGVAVHEFAADAMMNHAHGPFDIRWRVDGPRLVFEWREDRKRDDRSHLQKRTGSRLLSHLIEDQLGGRIIRRLEDNLAVFQIELPVQAALLDHPMLASPSLS
jgi:two-component sensor histidine kinase